MLLYESHPLPLVLVCILGTEVVFCVYNLKYNLKNLRYKLITTHGTFLLLEIYKLPLQVCDKLLDSSCFRILGYESSPIGIFPKIRNILSKQLSVKRFCSHYYSEALSGFPSILMQDQHSMQHYSLQQKQKKNRWKPARPPK